MSFKNKRILITAGPTWAPLDKVRVISNIATGETGILLAEKLQRLGAKVTLLFGPAGVCCLSNGIRLIRFRFFDELNSLLKRELESNSYDIVIHSAAVSDYRPRAAYGHKVKSGIKQWSVDLVATPKIIDMIKKIDPHIFLVGFKFEPKLAKARLINQAKILLKHSEAELVVANSIYNAHYNAYLISREKVSPILRSKNELADKLIREIGEMICQN
jgi:phosphopantothenoylcysteine decarboxylase/phosphopantothenate--cysteine ligase